MATHAYEIYSLTPKFNESLTTVLHQINKPQWIVPLSNLAHNFDKIPQIIDDSFESELLTVLHMIAHAYSTDPDAPLVDMAVIRLSKMLSFSVRGVKRVDNQTVYWHPLEQSWQSFDTPDTRITQQPDPYPTQDMIKRWLREQLT